MSPKEIDPTGEALNGRQVDAPWRPRVATRYARLTVVCALLACNQGKAPEEAPAPVGPKFVAFRETRVIIDRLEAPVAPPYSMGSSPGEVEIKSSDASVVTIDGSGNLVAHQNGTAVVSTPRGAQLRVEVVSACALSVLPAQLNNFILRKSSGVTMGFLQKKRTQPESTQNRTT